ncbi:MAG: class I SAM-dependent methyltransferase, partial [Candidatus Omnitrophota bacterium]
MNLSMSQRDTCRLCKSKKLEKVLPLTPTALCDVYLHSDSVDKVQEIYPLDLFLCLDCGYVHLPYVVDPEIIYRDYIYVSTSSLGLSKHFQDYSEKVLRRVNPSKNSLVVDLGSNDGTLLKFFKNKGMRVLGIEPANEIAKKASKEGVDTIPEFFNSKLAERIKNDYGTAGIITINNLFANIDDLEETAKSVKQLLAQDGVFIIESSYLGDMIKNMIFDFIYHEHLSYFSVKPLVKFFSRFGMELIDIERVPTKGGSLRYYFQHKNAGRAISPAVNDMMNYEKSLKLDSIETFKNFSIKIGDIKAKLNNCLSRIKAENKIIAGYGASATTTTLVYHLGLAEMIDYIVDDNIAKHNTFSPGYHIPVLPSEVLHKEKPDYILILAWRYTEAIVEKQKMFLKQDGRFIVPLPEVK